MPSSSKLAASACRQDHGLVAVRIPLIRLAVTLKKMKLSLFLRQKNTSKYHFLVLYNMCTVYCKAN